MARTHLPLRRAIPVGIAAYVLGYFLTVGLAVGRVDTVLAIEVTGQHVESLPLGQLFASKPPAWVVVGWLFYNAHFVPTSVPAADAANGFAALTNRSLAAAVDGPLLLSYLVPPLLLLAAGFLVARTATTPGANGARNAGASVAIGYFPLFLLGAFVFTANAAEARVTASPNGLRTVLFGLVYPLVLGALGGTLAERRGEPETAVADETW